MSKRSKRKRMRRAYLKPWSASYVNVGKGPSAGWASEYSKRSRHVDYQREKLFNLPNTVNEPRLEALKKIEEFTNNANPLHNICLESSPRKVLLLFFGSTKEWFFVKRENATFSRSICYSTRDAAMQVWRNSRSKNKIIWVETFTT